MIPLRYLWSPVLVILPLLAAASTWGCHANGYRYDMPDIARFFFMAVFFCFTILVGTADRRRFQAFENLAQIKANLIGYWHLTLELGIPADDRAIIKRRILGVLPVIYDFLRDDKSLQSADDVHKVDVRLQDLAEMAEIFRRNELQSPEISRFHQWIQQIYTAFETILSIKEYRTPKTLRDFLKFAMMGSVVLLSPGFAMFGVYGIALAGVIGFLLSYLIQIQSTLDLPFGSHPDEIKKVDFDRFQERIQKMDEDNRAD